MQKLIFSFIVIFLQIQAYSQCACCAGASLGSSNGDYTLGMHNLHSKIVIAEAYGDYREIKKGDAVEDDEKLLRSMFISTVGLRYVASNKITFSTILPYVYLRTNNGDDYGLGDLMFMVNYNVFAKNNFGLAFQAGVELPTGIQKSSNFDNTTIVVGSGSYDPIVGASISKRIDKINFQGNAQFKWTNDGFEGNNYGNLGTQNVSVSYSFKEESSFCNINKIDSVASSNFGFRLFAGYYGEWLDKIKEDDLLDGDSGYYMGFATLGTNLSYKKWAFPITYSYPVISKMNGDQNEGGWRLRFGIIHSF